MLQALPPSLESAGALAVGADVAADLRQLVVRNVQAVVAAELEVEVVADDAPDLLGVEADEAADAVVLVHDVVAAAQVGDRRERAPEPGRAAGAAAAQELGGGQHREPQGGRHEAVPKRRDAERDARLVGPGPVGRGQVGLHPAQGHVRAPGLAEVSEAHEHAVAGAHERAQLVLGLADAARGERGQLGLELVWLAERHLLERRHRVDQVGDGRGGDVAAGAQDGIAQALGRLGVRALDLRGELGRVPGDDGRRRPQLGRERHEAVGHDGAVAVLAPPA